jgi:hypothetical protein
MSSEEEISLFFNRNNTIIVLLRHDSFMHSTFMKIEKAMGSHGK